MASWIYIAGVYNNLGNSICKVNDDWVDGDPHFTKNAITWGICRPDLRSWSDATNYIFFVLPKTNSVGVQCVFAYLQIDTIITHDEAFFTFPACRMKKGKNPQGNIIVDKYGKYNSADEGAHRKNFEKIKKQYAVGNTAQSRKLSNAEIRKLGPSFNAFLNELFDEKSKTNFQIITRRGKVLNKERVNKFLQWLKG